MSVRVCLHACNLLSQLTSMQCSATSIALHIVTWSHRRRNWSLHDAGTYKRRKERAITTTKNKRSQRFTLNVNFSIESVKSRLDVARNKTTTEHRGARSHIISTNRVTLSALSRHDWTFPKKRSLNYTKVLSPHVFLRFSVGLAVDISVDISVNFSS